MTMTVIQGSSAIDAVDYDYRSKELKVYMTDGTTVIYQEVPDFVYESFINAPSAGKYYNMHIRNDFPVKKGKH